MHNLQMLSLPKPADMEWKEGASSSLVTDCFVIDTNVWWWQDTSAWQIWCQSTRGSTLSGPSWLLRELHCDLMCYLFSVFDMSDKVGNGLWFFNIWTCSPLQQSKGNFMTGGSLLREKGISLHYFSQCLRYAVGSSLESWAPSCQRLLQLFNDQRFRIHTFTIQCMWSS